MADEAARLQRYVTFAAVLLLGGVAITATMLILRPIVIRDEWSGPAPAERLDLPDMRLDLNTASAEELTLLPGIGPALAKHIVELRRARGRFESLDDLRQVSGLGPARIEAIGPHVVIDPAE